ncbi:MAG TPA: VWA domain-containing protein [Candidatus Polarisedimenticolia bacterium]|nr:VWA domain-containing protein [Candidatus Polarisedimenticolia bacterium]
MPTSKLRLASVLAASLTAAAPCAASDGGGQGAAAEAPFTLAVTAPSPLYLVGRSRIEAAAFDPQGRPYAKVAWMSLSVDGGEALADGRPPFAWEIDLGGSLERRRLQLEAVDSSGRRARLSVLSSTHPYVEAVRVDLVLVPVTVREESPAGPGRAVTGLTAADFSVLEEGAARPITSFSAEPMPVSVALALDNSASMEGTLWSARKAAAEFARRLPRWAAVSLLTFNDQVFLEQEFTHDPEVLASSAAAVRAEGTRTALLDALRIGSLHLARRPGARAMVVFTDGRETVHEEETGRLQTAIEAAQEADVAIYAVAFGAADRPPLEEMARQTGGELLAAGDAGALTEAFAAIAESLGTRYLLGFEPAEQGPQANYRRLEVKLSRPGLRVAARRGYYLRSSVPPSPEPR